MSDRTCYISYGKEKITVRVPDENLIGCFKPRQLESSLNEDSVITEALANPIGLPPLNEIAKKGMKIAIVVDDNTRPTPTAKMLPFILDILHSKGVGEEDITIVFANGSHRLNTREEQVHLLGGEHILNRYKICDHNPHDISSLTYLGKTSRGTPVHINKYVAGADLRILTGLIKPHAVAGYTGGGKSILPGVSSIETIISDHNYQATSHDKAVLGVIDGNPIRSDIEEAAHLISPCFILNVILDDDKKIVSAVAGDMIEAHRAGAKMLDELVCVPVHEEADIIVAGCSYPTSINLYQSVNAVLNCMRMVRPIIKKGGIVIAAAPCTEGIGGGPFHQLVKESPTIQAVLDKISEIGFFLHDQWAAQLWASALIYSDVYLVAEGLTNDQVIEMKATPFSSVQQAFDKALMIKGKESRVTVLSDAPYTIPKLL